MISRPQIGVSGRVREMVLNLRSLPWVRWDPGLDTLHALATTLYMIPSYYFMANNRHQLAGYNFLLTSLLILVLLPAYNVVKVLGEPLENIGLTKKRWLPSLLISLLIVSKMYPRFAGVLSNVPSELVAPTILFNCLCFWEPFFVFCWIQLRFERAFGIIPGILAAGLCLGSYHIGTCPWEMVISLGMVGLFLGGVFRLTKNLLTMWPLTWTVASTMGTVAGGFTFGWTTVWVYTVILLAQGTGIWYIGRTGKQR